ETFVSPDAASGSTENGTAVQSGSLENVLLGETLSIAPENGAAISKASPVEVSYEFPDGGVEMEEVILETPADSANAVKAGTVLVYEEGKETPIEILFGEQTAIFSRAKASASWSADGSLHISLGGQVAVKKVTFKITATAGSTNLAEISRVEFVGDMAGRIPEPEMNIPADFTAAGSNKAITVSWTKQTNVTAYEVAVTQDGKTEYKKTTGTSLVIRQFGGKDLVNNTVYTVKVQSLNGEWKSGYTEELSVTPKAEGVPDAPDNVKITGGYRTVTVSWSANEDADSYNLYYKEEGAESFEKIEGITASTYQLGGLKDSTKYTVYMTGSNDLGEGPASPTVSDSTIAGLVPVKLPGYKLINTSNGEGVLSAHIKAASFASGASAAMVDSALDAGMTGNSALGLFDNDYNSYFQANDWDYGGAYHQGSWGITTEFDEVYSIGMLTLAEPLDVGSYSYVHVRYQDGDGNWKAAPGTTIQQRTSGNRRYYQIKFSGPVETSKIMLGIGRYGASPGRVTVSEICFYEYDSLEQDILSLYADNLYITLKDTVTEELLDELQARLDTADPVSGEYHPDREALQKELDAARTLFATGNLGEAVQINSSITLEKDKQIAVGGLNAWQPLGVAASAGEQIVVYVGNAGQKAGAAARVQLVVTQYHAENTEVSKTLALRVGRNEITVPQLTNKDVEQGGALYIQYTGNNANDSYAVRVSGGAKIPILNVYGLEGEARAERIETYVQELNAYVAKLEESHNEYAAEHESANKTYDAKNCILNATDIVMNQMMLSLPASQVLAGLGSGDQAERLTKTIEAMEDMMILFYQHKGLTNSFAEGTEETVKAKNHLPYCYQNIRYMRMFSGAFMYAAGSHIGIEWPETPGMMSGTPVVSNENGKYESGRYFGWGIAHEVGHEINQSAYAHAEVTNNYFSVLAQAKDTNDSVRFQYQNVFDKVTSGASGYADNVFTQLGLYWQLHLAYDRDYNYKTYDTYQEILENLFFARVDSYARDTSAAPAPGGVALTLGSERDQNLMRLASAAAEKDLTDFFTRWGMTPDAATASYMGQFEKETRAIYYVDDTARVYEMTNGVQGSLEGQEAAEAAVSADGSEVKLTFTFKGANKDVLQGYEIVRVSTEQGVEKRETVGFTQENSFTDRVSMANRVVSYEITAIDKYMNRSAVYRTDAVKVESDGLQEKELWTVETNLVSDADTTPESSEGDPCEPEAVSASYKTVDGDKNTVFTGKTENAEPYLILKLHKSTELSALRYTLEGAGNAIGAYRIEVSEDGSAYTKVKEGKFDLKNGSETVYFENGTDLWVTTYDAAYVKLTAVGQQGSALSIGELDLYGPTGDNVEFLSVTDGQTGIGLLKEDYVYGQSEEEKIPAGSLIFTGSYKGNPAYNVVVLYDENGEIVGGVDADGAVNASQIILAEVPENAMLGEVSDGTWIYWIEPSVLNTETLPKTVRAELYRVDNALTNEGQRLVSDTLPVQMPEKLPELSLGTK
ncbi:MAG: M60 family metallopeptidase, partial [Eubacteriales bacterium]|nr:M60 family metallopeptidase [Eubacteriales bacterium]